MDFARLHAILNDATTLIRKGAVLHGTPELVTAIEAGSQDLPGGVATFDMMPSEAEVPADLSVVDLELVKVGVDQRLAGRFRDELIALLKTYPQPDRLAAGPSYIEVGAEIGDQGAAFQLFALGKVCGLWDIITPAAFGMSGQHARDAAGSGFIMITGFRPSPTEKDDGHGRG